MNLYVLLFKGESICLYSSKAEKIPLNSSRVYTVQTRHGWYDAEELNGRNIGQFANQKGIVDTWAMSLIEANKSKFVNMDWKLANKHAKDLVNTRLEVVHHQLHIVAKDDIPPSPVATEVFVWIPLIVSI